MTSNILPKRRERVRYRKCINTNAKGGKTLGNRNSSSREQK